MQINGPKKLVGAAAYMAAVLGVFSFKLDIVRTEEGSYCRQNEDGSFVINIQKGIGPYWKLRHLSHEIAHLKQYKLGELVGDCETEVTLWKGKKYFPTEYMSDDYYLSPWEMDARALEEWLVHKWESKKNELH